MDELTAIIKELQSQKNPAKAKLLSGFFKTGKGEYGEGDVFLGLTVPQQRLIAKNYADLPLSDIEKLLKSPVHEYRLTSLFILMDKFKKATSQDKKDYYNFYLSHTKWINNWDLIDLSSRDIVGGWLRENPKQKDILVKLAHSKSLWERRIAVIATFAFFRDKEVTETLKIAEILLRDHHDLIHKAVGWALREVGKIDVKSEEKFLNQHYKTMPRTMLRYAIEKFDEKKRQYYLKK